METRKVYSFWVVRLNRLVKKPTKNDVMIEESRSYYEKKEDAKRVAVSLSKPWLDDPWTYLVTTEHNDIRVYNKTEDCLWAEIFIEEHKFVEVG